MAQTRERAARANGSALIHFDIKGLDNLSDDNTTPQPFRQEGPAAWIVRRVPVSLAAARVYADLHGIGGAE